LHNMCVSVCSGTEEVQGVAECYRS